MKIRFFHGKAKYHKTSFCPNQFKSSIKITLKTKARTAPKLPNSGVLNPCQGLFYAFTKRKIWSTSFLDVDTAWSHFHKHIQLCMYKHSKKVFYNLKELACKAFHKQWWYCDYLLNSTQNQIQSTMYSLTGITRQSSKQEVLEVLVKKFSPYAQNLLNSGGDFSYMNMYADNFQDQLVNQTSFTEYDIYTLLNEACDISWRNQAK